MRVMNFDEPVSMADGTLKTLADMGGDSGGGSGGSGGSGGGSTVESFNDRDLPKIFQEEGILILCHNDTEDTEQIEVTGNYLTMNYRFNMTKGSIYICPVGPDVRLQLNGSSWGHNRFYYYH